MMCVDGINNLQRSHRDIKHNVTVKPADPNRLTMNKLHTHIVSHISSLIFSLADVQHSAIYQENKQEMPPHAYILSDHQHSSVDSVLICRQTRSGNQRPGISVFTEALRG